MTDVRLRFAGIIGFLSKILSLFTGLAFTILITRNLSIIEFAQWGLINSILIYGALPASILGYWFSRYTARGIPIAKYGILISFFFIVAGVVLFFLSGYLFLEDFEILLPVLLFASLQVPTSSLVGILSSIANGKKPEYSSYGFLAFEIIKVLIAFIVVFSKGISLLDAIIIVIIAEGIQAIILTILLRDEIKKKVNFENLKKMFRAIWIPLFNQVPGTIFSSDVLIVSLITASLTQIAFFKIGIVFSGIISFGGYLVYPLYIKLLNGGKSDDIAISIKLMLTFTIPLAVGIFILAKPLLFLLNPEYVASEFILQILVLTYLTIAIRSIFTNIILGKEKIDIIESKSDFKKMFFSSHMRIPVLGIIEIGMYVGTLSAFALISLNYNLTPEIFGQIWASILFATSIPQSIILFKMAKKRMMFSWPWKNIGKYIISSAVMSLVLLYLIQFLSYNAKVILFLPELLLIIFVAIISYFGFLLSIDKETRMIVSSAISKIKK